jgi:hypothetical protein
MPISTYECKPTLNDSQVLEFCKKGYLLLEGVVPDDINRRTLAYDDEKAAAGQLRGPDILEEDWFMDGVILQPDVAGAVRSLLGNNFAPPRLMAKHRVECPGPAQEWHRDGRSVWTDELNYLQVFYYPQDCPREMGPTEVLPGSHHMYANRDYMAHYGRIKGSSYTVAPAGSVFLTVYSIWHRRSESSATGVRNLLKYNYWRTDTPKRDWIIEPGFDFATADYAAQAPTFRVQFRDIYDSAKMYFWLRGESDKFRALGGQGWPFEQHRYAFDQRPFGLPEGVE